MKTIKINFKPSEKEINSILNMQTFVDFLIINREDLPGNILGSDFSVWRWAIVSVGDEFKFPVPINENENGKMNLYKGKREIEFELEEAALVLTKYYFLMFSNLYYSTISGGKASPFAGFAISQGVEWMKKSGGEESVHENFFILDKRILSDSLLYSKAYPILD